MKINLLASILLLIAIQASAQELSFNFDAGYGLKIATESISEGYSNRIAELETEFRTIVYSHGRGLNFNAEMEYFPKKQIGFGLGIGYLEGQKFEVLFNRIDYVSVEEYTASMVRFSPYVKFKQAIGKFAIYSRFGYLLGAFGDITIKDNWHTDKGMNGFSKTIYDKGVSHGGTAGLGMEIKINDRLNVSGEVKLLVQSYGPRRSRVVELIKNGENILNEQPPGYIQSNYVDHYVRHWDPSGSTDYSKPLTELRRFYPFSSVGLNLGIQYKLMMKKKSKK